MPIVPAIKAVGGAGGTTVAPSSPPVCSDCGGCTFSANSQLRVEKREWECPGPTSSIVSQVWPFDSADATRVRYQFDADNYAEYRCESNRWTVVATQTEFDPALCPLTFNGPPIQLDTCSSVTIYAVNGSYSYLVFSGNVENNNCVPSVAV